MKKTVKKGPRPPQHVASDGQYLPRKRIRNYKEGMGDKLIEHMSQGASEYRACINMGISYDAHKKWIKEVSEYKDAYEYARTAYIAYMDDIGMGMATGEIQGNATVYCGIMNNRGDWKGKEAPGPTYQQVNHYNGLSDDELDKKIKMLVAKSEKLDENS